MTTDPRDAEAESWAHSVDMYTKWACLGTGNAIRMMQLHRDRFPTMSKIFDQIDKEARHD